MAVRDRDELDRKMMDLMLVEIDILEYMHDANKVKGLGSEV